MSAPVLAVLDPGLMEAGGHHAGFALVASGTAASRGRLLSLTAHEELSPELQNTGEIGSQLSGFRFTHRFYQLFDKETSLARAHSFIAGLAKEYTLAMDRVVREHPERQVQFFYPCLAWEHGAALSLALTGPGCRHAAARHLVCAMFNPGVDHKGRLSDPTRFLLYRTGFLRLHRTPGVRLYAGSRDLAHQYATLLDLENPLPTHPCYLADWKVFRRPSPARTGSRIMLFAGDAKINKGFHRVPGIITQLLPQVGPDDTLVIHYTLTWNNPEVRQAIIELHQLAAQDPRVELHTTFWSDEELHRQLRTIDLFLFTYDQVTYMDKSSGILWLLAQTNARVLCLAETWITREATRLGVPVTLCRMDQVGDHIARAAKSPAPSLTERKQQPGFDQEYWNMLYRDFWKWVEEEDASCI